jgi:hypothetical protein
MRTRGFDLRSNFSIEWLLSSCFLICCIDYAFSGGWKCGAKEHPVGSMTPLFYRLGIAPSSGLDLPAFDCREYQACDNPESSAPFGPCLQRRPFWAMRIVASRVTNCGSSLGELIRLRWWSSLGELIPLSWVVVSWLSHWSLEHCR